MKTSNELNKLAVDTIDEIRAAEHFQTIQVVDNEIAQYPNPKDTEFYLKKQDVLNECFGEITTHYFALRAELKTYVAVRKNEERVLAVTNKEKVPANDAVEEKVLAEIPELYNATIVLEGWRERADNSIKTCRSHTYSGKETNNIEND